MRIRIVRRPIGEAPAWVRDAWTGLSLPLATPSAHTTHGFGVLSTPSSRLGEIWAILRGKSIKMNGYFVDARLAVELLEVTRPEAAQWWRDNAPRMLDGTRYFIFDTPCSELLEGA
jgi:hypothetical protein